MRTFRVYGAGKMGARSGKDVLDERRRARVIVESWGMEFADPALNEYVDPNGVVDMSMDYVTMKSFVAKDEYAISRSDALLVLTGDTPSEGTGQEIALALHLGLPVILVAPKRVSGTLMGFWNVKATAMFSTVEEAAEYLAENYALYADY